MNLRHSNASIVLGRKLQWPWLMDFWVSENTRSASDDIAGIDRLISSRDQCVNPLFLAIYLPKCRKDEAKSIET